MNELSSFRRFDSSSFSCNCLLADAACARCVFARRRLSNFRVEKLITKQKGSLFNLKTRSIFGENGAPTEVKEKTLCAGGCFGIAISYQIVGRDFFGKGYGGGQPICGLFPLPNVNHMAIARQYAFVKERGHIVGRVSLRRHSYGRCYIPAGLSAGRRSCLNWRM